MKWKEKTPFQKGVTVAAWVFIIAALVLFVLEIVNRYTEVNIAGVRDVYRISLGLAFSCMAILDWQTRKSNAILYFICGGIYLLIGILRLLSRLI